MDKLLHFPSSFTYQNAPTISSVSPDAGNPAGNTPIAITGSNFLTGATVNIGANPCAGVTVNPPYNVSCSTPAGTIGAVDVMVSNTDGQFATLASGFTYQNAPTITSVSPATDNPAGGTPITITGLNFLTEATVNIGKRPCSNVVVNPTSITCTTPAGTVGMTDITISHIDGQSAILASGFTYQNAPTISSIFPNAGNPAGETLITILGSDFLTGATVDIGSNPCTNIAVNPTRITCTTPTGTLGVTDITVTNTDGQSIALASGFTYQNAPTITSVSPATGKAVGGTSITIAGSDFLTGATVNIGTNLCSNVVVNSTSITCITPSGMAGMTDIIVTNTDGQSIALASGFTYQNAPTITSVSPATGKAVGGTSITIAGSDFLTGATVNIGTNLCSNVVVNSTSITCTTPSGMAGMTDIIVTNTDGQSIALASGFTYQNAPTISSISPATDNPAGGASITITGSNFSTDATVNIGTNPCSNIVTVSPTRITCTTPAGTVGVADITVTNTDKQTITLSSSFTYQDAPTISSVSPNAGNPIGGTSITITGSGLLTGATVNVGKNLCLSVDINPTSITCTTPAGTIGIADITVTNTDGQTVTLPSSFTYQNAPTISSISPNVGNPAGNTPIAITGSNFLTGATVDIGANPCVGVTVNPPYSVSCSTPVGTVGAVDVMVSNTDEQFATLASGFTYQNAPTITSVSPTTGYTVGGETITITGTDFHTIGATKVEIGGLTCTSVKVTSSTQMTCDVPVGIVGEVDVKIINPDGQSVTLASSYTYQEQEGTSLNADQVLALALSCMASTDYVQIQQCLAALPSSSPDEPSPTITGISAPNPAAGPLSGGSRITIDGTNFINGATVDMGGTVCTVTSVTSTQIICTNASHAAGSVDITVTNPDGQSDTLASGYTYQTPILSPPSITGISAPNPAAGALSGGSRITIDGTNFIDGTTVDMGGSVCTVTSVTSTQIVCTNASHAAGNVDITVTNPDGKTATLKNGYIYQAGPVIYSITPDGGNPLGGSPITITGSGFLTGTTINIGSKPCFIYATDYPSKIFCLTPAGSLGVVSTSVKNPDGQSYALAYGFTYQNAPTITSIFPTTGSPVGGNKIIINGKDFLKKGRTTVGIGGLPCTSVKVISSTQITCVVPKGTTGAADVEVINPDGQSMTLASLYNYQTTVN